VSDIESGEVKLMIDEVVECELEGAGKKLPLQVNVKKPGAGINVFVASHLHLRNFVFCSTLIFDLVHGTMCKCSDFLYSLVMHIDHA
jgi:hypothetical protein